MLYYKVYIYVILCLHLSFRNKNIIFDYYDVMIFTDTNNVKRTRRHTIDAYDNLKTIITDHQNVMR